VASRAKLYKRGEVWWCWFYDHRGKQVRLSTHQSDQPLARQAARRLEREYLNAPPSDAAPIDELIATYLASTERKGRSEETLAFYLRKVKPLIAWFQATDANTLTLAKVEAYMDHRLSTPNARGRAVNVATVAKEIGLLRSSLRYARKVGRFKADVEALLPDEIQGAYVPRERALSRAEFKALLQALPDDRRDYVAAWCLTGARESELYRITTSDVDLAGGQLRVPGTKTDRSNRHVPIQPDLHGLLERRMDEAADGAELFPLWRNVRRDLRSACKSAGMPRRAATTSAGRSRPGSPRRACRNW
jgi:integrase